MPSTLVAGLAAQLRAVQASIGTGEPQSSTAALASIRDALTDVAVAAGGSWQGTRWVGDAGDAAGEFTRATVAAVEDLAARTEHLGATVTTAADAVSRARARLRAIVDEFEARAAALEARLDEPGTADELIEEARRALDEARGVVDDLRAELDVHQAAVAPPAAAPAPTMPTGALPGLGSGGGSGLGSGPGLASALTPGLASGLSSGPSSGRSDPASLAGFSADRPDPPAGQPGEPPASADPGMFGTGTSVHLPDGSTATAPNPVAAEAVRNALTQLGVPYDWGGTSPGRGLDCSGLTQWAYHEAGLDLPRLAQEQDVGAAVGRGSLRPGDLAVWDGHVAMVVGNGLMIEAGSPVKLSPIRTTNAGQGFQGFWRPTA